MKSCSIGQLFVNNMKFKLLTNNYYVGILFAFYYVASKSLDDFRLFFSDVIAGHVLGKTPSDRPGKDGQKRDFVTTK